MFFKTGIPSKPFSESTLIIPVVSIGNVPQLAIDLVISTEKLSRIGTIESCYVYSITGDSAYEHSKEYHTSPIEVYQTQDGKFTVIQPRSPCYRHQKKFLAAQLLKFYKENSFIELLILASSNASFADDFVLDGPKAKIIDICNPVQSEFTKKLELHGTPVIKLPRSGDLTSTGTLLSNLSIKQAPNLSSNSYLSKNQSLSDLVNSGIAKHLINECISQNISADALVMFVNEGDNVPEAIVFASLVNLGLLLLSESGNKSWVQPQSWKWLQVDNIPQSMFY